MPWHFNSKGWNNCYFCGIENDGENLRCFGDGEPDANLVLCCKKDTKFLAEFFKKYGKKMSRKTDIFYPFAAGLGFSQKIG